MRRIFTLMLLVMLMFSLFPMNAGCENDAEFTPDNITLSDGQPVEYSVTVNGTPCGSIMVFCYEETYYEETYYEETYALPMVQVYTLIGSEIKTNGSDITIIVNGIGSVPGQELQINSCGDSVIDMFGYDLLFQPPGCESWFIHVRTDDDFYVDEETLFGILFLTTDWYFHIHPENNEIEIALRLS